MIDIKGIKNMIAQGVGSIRLAFRGKTAAVQSGGATQRVQIDGLAGETLQSLEQMQQFGFTSHPPPGTDALIVPLGGVSSHGIIVATENGAYRIKGLAAGEVAVYDQSGSSIVLKQGRLIEIDCDRLSINAPSGVEITAPNVQCSAQLTAMGQINGNGGMAVQGGGGASFTGDIRLTGDFSSTGGVVNNGKNIGSSHGHIDSRGDTSQGVL